jgi:hypothetical protein
LCSSLRIHDCVMQHKGKGLPPRTPTIIDGKKKTPER